MEPNQANQKFIRVGDPFPFPGRMEPVPRIETDGRRILFERPEKRFRFGGQRAVERIRQQRRTNACSLKHGLNKQLFNFSVPNAQKALDDAIVIDVCACQEPRFFPVCSRKAADAQFIKIIGILVKNRVKIQPVVEDFNFSKPLGICFVRRADRT